MTGSPIPPIHPSRWSKISSKKIFRGKTWYNVKYVEGGQIKITLGYISGSAYTTAQWKNYFWKENYLDIVYIEY